MYILTFSSYVERCSQIKVSRNSLKIFITCSSLMTLWSSLSLIHKYAIPLWKSYTVMNLFHQMKNINKSSISFSAKTFPTDWLRDKKYLGIEKEGDVHGTAEAFWKEEKKDLLSIMDCIKRPSINCYTRFISTTRKTIILPSIAIPTFVMIYFQLYVSPCKRMQSVLTRFW